MSLLKTPSGDLIQSYRNLGLTGEDKSRLLSLAQQLNREFDLSYQTMKRSVERGLRISFDIYFEDPEG